ncbi:MAG: transcriptional repressor [Burkholderiaceae bacterium]|nr:transcriptional repressor [Burkholderiaceae bacterium]
MLTLSAESRLRAAGVRVTAARVKVLTELSRASSAMTHQDFLVALPDMDRVTLYRSLECLIANGLAHRITGGDRASRYGIEMEAGNPAHETGLPHRHGHFECVSCAKVFCLSHTAGHYPNLQQILDDLSLTLGEGFQSDDIELTIKGRCADCIR